MDMTVAPTEREGGSDDELWDLPTNWCWTEIGSVARLRGEKVDPLDAPDLPFVGMDDIANDGLRILHTKSFATMKSTGNKFEAGDILYGRLRPYLNKTAIADSEGAASGELLAIVSSIEPRFLQFYLHGRRFVNQAMSAVSGDRPRIDFPKIGGFSFPLAPLAEQRRIVERIDALFAEIADGEAALEEARKGLETFRRSLLKAAVTGELTRDWRETNKPTETGHDLLARIRAERAVKAPNGRDKRARAGEPLDTSELPDLPEGWAWARLDEIIVSGPTNGYSPKTSSDGSGTLSLKLTATTRGEIDLSDRATKTLSETIEQGSDLYLVPGDLLFQRGNTIEYVGIAAIYDGPESTYVYPDLMIRVRTSDRWLAEWIWRVANSPMGRKFMMDNATGTAGTMPKISGAILRRLPIPIPPTSEIGEILRRVSEGLAVCSDAVTLFEVQTADAARLRQAILKSAFEGTLVPQDPHDEPASALLTNISARTVNPSKRHRASAKKTRGRSST
ncbi:restriction endonuclease subunit S [Rhizobium sp. CNPSo 3464]|uniref:restriction endonuclease subunit S n=1 Tax=Rhizobium sp. CNPSo 3464 TaxID=3021406 RepID=UPI00255111F9|nr:restriction endonuclease subunit S [Rhizobium sp. CNPSo 3464]MDK4739398.1 restriction endonuclease subunit S [Rhizobium sp. CNPSo 3464]